MKQNHMLKYSMDFFAFLKIIFSDDIFCINFFPMNFFCRCRVKWPTRQRPKHRQKAKKTQNQFQNSTLCRESDLFEHPLVEQKSFKFVLILKKVETIFQSDVKVWFHILTTIARARVRILKQTILSRKRKVIRYQKAHHLILKIVGTDITS